MRAIRAAAIGVALLVPLALDSAAVADDGAGAPPPPPPPIPAPTAPPEAPVSDRYTPEQLKELVGPVALYPDIVLASLLPATTAPLDVIAAARYVEAQGGKTPTVPAGTTWDKSVQAMLQFPDALKWMAENPEWLKQIGEAVATQQADVLSAVQTFRHDAQKAGNLKSDDKMAVRDEPAPAGSSAQQVIVIEPATPTAVYVPTYDPYAVSTTYVESPYVWGSSYLFPSYGPWGYTSLCWYPRYGYGWGLGYGYGYYGPSICSSGWPVYWGGWYGHSWSNWSAHGWHGHHGGHGHGWGGGGGGSWHGSHAAIARTTRGGWGSGAGATGFSSGGGGRRFGGGSASAFDTGMSRRWSRGGSSFSSSRAATVGGGAGQRSFGRWRGSSQGTGGSQGLWTDGGRRGWNRGAGSLGGGGSNFRWNGASQGSTFERAAAHSVFSPGSTNLGTSRWSGGGQRSFSGWSGGRGGGGGHRGRR